MFLEYTWSMSGYGKKKRKEKLRTQPKFEWSILLDLRRRILRLSHERKGKEKEVTKRVSFVFS